MQYGAYVPSHFRPVLWETASLEAFKGAKIALFFVFCDKTLDFHY